MLLNERLRIILKMRPITKDKQYNPAVKENKKGLLFANKTTIPKMTLKIKVTKHLIKLIFVWSCKSLTILNSPTKKKIQIKNLGALS